MWTENVVKEIRNKELHVKVLQSLANIMYSSNIFQGQDVVTIGTYNIIELHTLYPLAIVFLDYFDEYWTLKANMWIIGNKNIPHSNQDTNADVESYHHNVKTILSTTRQKFTSRCIDWLIYYLVEDVLTHYWYGIQCKIYRFIKNHKVKRIVASAILRIRNILDEYVNIFPDDRDIALVLFVNNMP